MAVELGEAPTNVQKAATLWVITIRGRYGQAPAHRSGVELPSAVSGIQRQSAPVCGSSERSVSGRNGEGLQGSAG